VVNIASTGTGQPLPPHDSVVVSWRTELRARRGMGRTFIGPLTDAAQGSDGTPFATFLSDLVTAGNTLLEASEADTAGWAVGVWGLQSPGEYDQFGRLIPGQAHVHRDCTSFKIRDKFAVLRSRRD
jgi:hypothetical protein